MKIKKTKTPKQENVTTTKRITRIYLVWNIKGKPWRVYIGKTKTKQGRIAPHKRTFGKNIFYDYIDQVNSWKHKDWKSLEVKWIKWFRKQGYEVLNKNNGGGGVISHTKESNNKRSKSLKKYYKNNFNSNKGKKQSKEWLLKRTEALKGRKFSEKSKKKMSLSKKGVPKPKGFGELISKVKTLKRENKLNGL